jgi:hypothetical protein
MENAMLAFDDSPYSNGTFRRFAARAVAYCRAGHACGKRLIELRSVNESLARINRDQHGAGQQRPSWATLESLRSVTTRVARQLTTRVDWATASTRTTRQYIRGLRDLILAYGTTQSLLDGEDLDRLGWVAQRTRLEYLRAGLVVRNGDSVDASIECGAMRAMRLHTVQM